MKILNIPTNVTLSFFFVLLGLCEVVYALSQYKMSPNGITGHFDNPAGFAATLIALLPFAVYLITARHVALKCSGILAVIIFITGIVLSESRAGLIALVILCGIYIFRYTKRHFSRLSRILQGGILTGITVCFVVGSIVLYYAKKDSANGRLLIWESSFRMIADKPIFGHGSNSFTAKYMIYQAQYFENNTESKFALLADNTKEPFNEYLGSLISFGFIGTLILILMLWGIFKNGLQRITKEKSMALQSLIGIGVFGLFSYPSNYVVVLVIITVAFSIITQMNDEVLLNIRIPAFSISIFFCFIGYCLCISSAKTILLEKHWNSLKTAAHISEPDSILTQYDNLYLSKKLENPLFLYNYGAVLNKYKQYSKSVVILKYCEQQINDSDVQVLLADNYRQINDYTQAERCAVLASQMCPNRFFPLYQLVLIYDETNRKKEALDLAKIIVDKPMKVQNLDIYKVKIKLKRYIDKNSL